ncbi:MAG: MazG family protein, partial [Chloroflexota bacterium]|nr:MazG family protein [Chloroflexota bacterium]
MPDIASLYADLGLDPSTPLQIVAAAELLRPSELGMTAGYLLNPMSVVLVTDVLDAGAVRTALDQVYPQGHPVRQTALGWLVEPLPPLDHGSYLAAVEYVIGRLRAPNGCPWDREQDHQSIKSNLLQESYEALEALDSGDMGKLAEELGDMLMQVLLHAEMARQAGEFDLRDVMLGISSKLVRRHPHVFGDVTANTASEVLQNWDEIKKKERAEGTSILASVAPAMPALAYAQEVSRRVARQGFDWPNIEGVLDKIQEELDEFL